MQYKYLIGKCPPSNLKKIIRSVSRGFQRFWDSTSIRCTLPPKNIQFPKVSQIKNTFSKKKSKNFQPSLRWIVVLSQSSRFPPQLILWAATFGENSTALHDDGDDIYIMVKCLTICM